MIPLLTEIVVVVTGLVVIGLVTMVGPTLVWEFRRRALDRFYHLFPYLLLIGTLLGFNSILRSMGEDLSWVIGWRITGAIYALEGNFVGWVQSFSHPVADVYFSYIYIYGYVFLLVFPVIAYLVLEDDRPVREAILAYTLNYGIGLVCYILFIAYGPRNVIPDMVDQLLYLHWPESNLLTSEINAPVNVFPSLHTSLAMTVALLAFRTRDIYPRWLPVATFLAVSVAVSTMYLGIHWLTDVVAGGVLAVISVGAAIWLTSPARRQGRIYRLGTYFRAPIDNLTRPIVGWVRERGESSREISRSD